MSRFFIGIEGGATKTEGILIDDTGKIYVTLQSGPSNPWVIVILYRKKLIEDFIKDSWI